MVRTKIKNKTDASIIEYLMLDSNTETTATTIASNIGLSSAKDITNRLNALHKKGIIRKLHRGKRVYWTIAESDEQPSVLQETCTGDDECNSVGGCSSVEELSDDENVEFANENNISTENEIDSKEEFPAGGIFRTYVTRELQTLRTAINNLCGQGNLVFGAVNTLELLKEIDTLREEVRKKDIIINNLREGKRGNYLDPPEPREQPPIWKIPPEIA